MFKGEHKSPDYHKIQTFGQVPAFQDESVTLFESRVICRYVCEKRANMGNAGLYSTNPLVKASIERWLEAKGQSSNPPSSILVFQLAFVPMMKIKQDEEKLGQVLDVYDKRLESSRFLPGDEFTLADLSHLPNTQYLVTVGRRGEMFTWRKNVGRWWDEISIRDSGRRSLRCRKVDELNV